MLGWLRARGRRLENTQDFTVEQRREAMGIDWMNGSELSQAIPPAYTQHIGEYLMRHLCTSGASRPVPENEQGRPHASPNRQPRDQPVRRSP